MMGKIRIRLTIDPERDPLAHAALSQVGLQARAEHVRRMLENHLSRAATPTADSVGLPPPRQSHGAPDLAGSQGYGSLELDAAIGGLITSAW